jgi:hypothetical protein
VRLSSWSRVRIDQTCPGAEDLAPINLPLFQGGRRGGLLVVVMSLSFMVSLHGWKSDQDGERWLARVMAGDAIDPTRKTFLREAHPLSVPPETTHSRTVTKAFSRSLYGEPVNR